ncbi:MAG: DJ-1/PfpI family protein [Oscillospiraceae bacterium]|nr:DJ-1/PfpI family protein [Oscillospiraceae bacterium]
MVYILLADGFEEAEAIVPADLLRRAGVQVALVGVTGESVSGAHGVRVQSDLLLSQVNPANLELLMLPGGLGGVEALGNCPAAMDLISQAARGPGWLAAICAAPTLLGRLGLLEGRRAVCYPGLEGGMTGALPQGGSSVVVDGRIVTGEGPGAAFDFGLKLVELLKGASAAAQVAADACWRH